MGRWQSANVLRAAGDTKRLWQFNFRGDNAHLSREETKLQKEPLPAKLISKDWQTLYKPRLNIAWLPADKVFIRVIQLPPADTMDEIASMLDLQLEKVSPLPTAQIVWSFDLLPKRMDGGQTAIVVIAARNLVEDFLGKLEGQSFLTDRLEVPFVDQLLAQKNVRDGVWIYPGTVADEETCLMAWWVAGVLQNVTLLHLPPAEERGAFIRDQLAQMAWAGELEGWLGGPSKTYLVADAELAATWRPLLETPEQTIEIVPPTPEQEIASLTARRAARDGVRPSLVPQEYTTRYRQQFVDRIWMRSVGAAIVVYLLGVVIYIGLLQWRDYGVSDIETQARGLSRDYTNALQLKARVQVMQDQLNLQFAALRCYRAVAENLPEGLTIESMSFQRGKTLLVYGIGDKSSQAALTEFSDKLRRYAVDDQPLFGKVNTPQWQLKPGTDTLSFNFQCELKNAESE
jgi:hypothetical protein